MTQCCGASYWQKNIDSHFMRDSARLHESNALANLRTMVKAPIDDLPLALRSDQGLLTQLAAVEMARRLPSRDRIRFGGERSFARWQVFAMTQGH